MKGGRQAGFPCAARFTIGSRCRVPHPARASATRAGLRPHMRSGNRRDARPTCRRPAWHRRCDGAATRRPTKRPAHRRPPAQGCALCVAVHRSRPDRAASRDRGLQRSPGRCHLRRRSSRFACATYSAHPQTNAPPYARSPPQQNASPIARCRARPRSGQPARPRVRSPRAPAARESTRRAARYAAARRFSGRSPSIPVAAATIRAGGSIRTPRRPARRRATDGAPPHRHPASALRQSGSPPPSPLNASRSPGWQSR